MKTKPNDLIGIASMSNGGIGQSHGLTKREYFAALVMQGFSDRVGMCDQNDMRTAAKMAVQYADLLIE